MSNEGSTIIVHLNHPCQEVDVVYCETEEEATQLCKAQGYIRLEDLRNREGDIELICSVLPVVITEISKGETEGAKRILANLFLMFAPDWMRREMDDEW